MKGVEKLVNVEEALEVILKENPLKFRTKKVKLGESLNKISCENVFSPLSYPPFSRSMMDGFALKHEDSEKGGRLKVIGRVNIGEEAKIKVRRGEAVEVDTGSMIPDGADAVVKIEDVKVTNGEIEVKPVKFGESVAWISSDFPKSFLILTKGEIINSRKVGVLASVGISEVEVLELNVGIIVTGDELLEPGERMVNGKIYNSNFYTLSFLLRELGCEVTYYAKVKDDKEEIRKKIIDAIQICDLVIISGGTSVGKRDYVKEILEEEGRVLLHGINIKPGKPAMIAVVRGKTVFGIPGNPLSAYIVTFSLIKNYIYKSIGVNWEEKTKAKSLMQFFGDRKRVTYSPVLLLNNYFLPVPSESYMIRVLSLSDGYVKVWPGEGVKEMEERDVFLFHGFEGKPIYIGEPSIIAERLRAEGFKVYDFGSYPALKALNQGVGDVIAVSSLVYPSVKHEMEMKRKIIGIGKDKERQVNYHEWLSLSRFNGSSSLKVFSPHTSFSLYLEGRAGYVVLPSDLFDVGGEEIGEETLLIHCKEEFAGKLKELLPR